MTGVPHPSVLRVRVFRQLQQKSKNPRNSTVLVPFPRLPT
jgi:hypothetical protein